MSIEPLLLARQKADPTFQYVKDSTTGQYHLQNRILLKYAPKSSDAKIRRSIDYLVETTNKELEKQGSHLRVVLDSVKITKDRTAIAVGSYLDLLKKGGNTTPPVGPNPPILPTDIEYDSILMVVAFQNDYNILNTVLPVSQIKY